MSTENDNLPNDEQLSSIYKETAQDMPAAHVDEAILAAARRETASRPRPAFSPFSGSWQMPAAVAAVVVISFSLVTLMENDIAPTDDLGSSAFDGTELRQPSTMMADKGIIREENPELVKALPKPAMKSQDEMSTSTRHALSTEQARRRAERDESKTKEKQKAAKIVAERRATPQAAPAQAPALTSSAVPLPSVALIRQHRLAGNLKQANQVADAFMDLYFGEKLTMADPAKVRLPAEQWVAFIFELRVLDRNRQADRLQILLDRR